MSLEIGERVVFHGVDGQAIETDGRQRDGEGDSVVAHLERGILIMERWMDHASLVASA